MPPRKFKEFDYTSTKTLTTEKILLKGVIFFDNARKKSIEKMTHIPQNHVQKGLGLGGTPKFIPFHPLPVIPKFGTK